ncbi:MAG: alkaline phosphatase D family protein [Umezawaea sp.]
MVKLVLGPVLRHVNATSATVWVETDASTEVEIAGHRARTFRVGELHYALVRIENLEPGATTEYDVRLDGEVVWPEPDSEFPPCRISTKSDEDLTHRIVFGSCRAAKPVQPATEDKLGPDALDAYALRMMKQAQHEWPDALLLLGDQVYADEPTSKTKEWLRKRRGGKNPVDEVLHFREYAQLYHESWGDPEIRWLMSTVPTSMIFDDHDIRDDWNTSRPWREQMAATSWWPERIRAGLASYWVYQHLGNLGPDELGRDDLYAKVLAAGSDTDVQPMLEEFGARADAELDGRKSTWWSYRRDYGRVRLLVIDTRCGRILSGDTRLMVGDEEFDWIERNAEGDYDHLVIGSSLPWLMPHAISHAQSINERAAARPGLRGRFGEQVRQVADLEHWPAFRDSFERLSGFLGRIGRGENAPSTICVLSGDVHHSYAAQGHYAEPTDSAVMQLTCSPVHNDPPKFFRPVFRLAWWPPMGRVLRRLADRAGVPADPLGWSRLTGPHFGNSIAVLEVDGRQARFVLESATPDGRGLVEVANLGLPPA